MSFLEKEKPLGPTLKPRPLKSGFGWYVLVEWPDGVARHVYEFRTESEARVWIAGESEAWLKQQSNSMGGPPTGFAPAPQVAPPPTRFGAGAAYATLKKAPSEG